MNMSKTEKLLAAKKKLKEFQLQKKLQVQETLNKDSNIIDESISQCQTNCQTTEVDKLYNQKKQNEVKREYPEKRYEKHIYNTDIMHKEENITNHFEGANNLSDMIETKIATSNSEITEKSFPSLENYPETAVLHESGDKDTTYSRLHSDLQYVGNDEKYNLNITTSNGPSTMQKEYLLEMASEVAHILTDDTDHSEPPSSLDFDLKCRNQFLSSCLEEQKQLVNDLHIQVSRYHSRVAELEEILATKDSEFEAKLVREINPLKEQLQFHAQTTGILIAEKAELTAALAQSQKTAKQNSEEIEEMSGKLKHSQLRINELEKELTQMRSNSTDTQKNAQQVQQVYNELEQNYYELRKEKEDLELETSELKQKLNLKNTEFITLQQEFQEKAALLSLNELRIHQLTDTSQTLESQHQTVTVLEQQLAQMRETLKLVNNEKDEASRQYQNYVRQLDAQQVKLFNEIESGKKIISELESREKSYIQRLSDLEQQLQHEREKSEAVLPSQDHNVEIANLIKNIEELTAQHEKLHIALSERDTEIEMLTKEIQQLRDMKDDGTDVAKLVQAFESEKLGASRAVSQNQQLKEQLTEMENAFVTLSNAKLDLTEQLQAERNIGRKLNARLNTVEIEMDNLKEKLKEKETLLIELEKEKLQNAQITDQMQHYQAQSHHAQTLQQELQNALIYIEDLKSENKDLTKELKNKVRQETDLSREILNDNEDQHVTKNEQNCNDIITMQNSPLPEGKNISDNFRPITKLENRFKETMEKVAELTDEKQKLEHLVLQLQGETETIGEYITLYQKQRAILGEKWKEREQTFRQLVEQRNQQQEQLHKLKVLVTDLLQKHPETLINSTEINYHKDTNADNPTLSEDKKQDNAELSLIEDKTASDILDLLTEIKDCKDTCIIESNFHPCPWCSGRLITV
ncbi:PREDICTED: golgin subfamily A member 2-like [Cyphomyrmex costatus]|uniref:Golgin subfamily A member 2 n=1 Tax=Cyphomyrmex costatus TaxID=456900 RepID=A0A195C5E5_9HYME|nr:PREDICTED: golgin subfamily A member 2-like [Cyphomyrmex costatus]KYM95393.1 Golgin subfamily A member 2 [Cyphomyrmex costatus]